MPPATNPTCVDLRNRLTNCADEEDIVYALNDLTPHVGKVARQGGDCYTIGEKERPTGDCISVSEPLYDDCEECQCYKLTKCGDSETVVWSDSDLSDYVGDVVYYDGYCYLVGPKEAPPDEEECVAVTVSDEYESCAACECDCALPGSHVHGLTLSGLPGTYFCDQGGGFGWDIDLPTTLTIECDPEGDDPCGCSGLFSFENAGSATHYRPPDPPIGPLQVNISGEWVLGIINGACTLCVTLAYQIDGQDFVDAAEYCGTLSGFATSACWTPGNFGVDGFGCFLWRNGTANDTPPVPECIGATINTG